MRLVVQASSPQSHLRFPLTQLLASGGHVRVLRALMMYGAPLSVAQIASECGLSTRGTRFVMASLVSQRMVGVLGQPRSQLYNVVPQHPMADAVRALFEHQRSRWGGVQEGLRAAFASQQAVQPVWLYGSVARGEDKPHSDVDVVLVVTEDGVEASHRVRDAVQALGDALGLHFSVVVFTPEELGAVQQDDLWWTDLVRDAKVLKGFSPVKELVRCTRPARPA